MALTAPLGLGPEKHPGTCPVPRAWGGRGVQALDEAQRLLERPQGWVYRDPRGALGRLASLSQWGSLIIMKFLRSSNETGEAQGGGRTLCPKI